MWDKQRSRCLPLLVSLEVDGGQAETRNKSRKEEDRLIFIKLVCECARHVIYSVNSPCFLGLPLFSKKKIRKDDVCKKKKKRSFKWVEINLKRMKILEKSISPPITILQSTKHEKLIHFFILFSLPNTPKDEK